MESASNKTSIAYHNIFDYPLTPDDLSKWKVGRKFLIFNLKFLIKKHANFQFINGRKKIIKKRIQNEKYSHKKLIIAKRAAKLIFKIPTVKFVGITGSLAMMNSDRNSDIDLMIITKSGRLWTTRLFVYLLLKIENFKLRIPSNKHEKDALCINLWLDEQNIIWDKADRNIYTAHEIAQIVPLFNKDNTYEKFIFLNKWILTFWPNSLKIKNWKLIENCKLKIVNYDNFFEKLAYKIQYQYMKPKITREVVTPTRAIFHPNDWGKVVMKKLNN